MAILALIAISIRPKDAHATTFQLADLFVGQTAPSYSLKMPPTLYVEAQVVPSTVTTKLEPVEANIELGWLLATKAGYTDDQWQCLYNLGMHESGWDSTAKNPTSGAYGIAQSLPASKMEPYGDIHSPAVQIRWFLDYVNTRYHGPCEALHFWVAQEQLFGYGWY